MERRYDEERRLESCKGEEDAKDKDTTKPGTLSTTMAKLEKKMKMKTSRKPGDQPLGIIPEGWKTNADDYMMKMDVLMLMKTNLQW